MTLPAPFAHQLRALEGVRAAYRRGARRVGVVLPTGGGKTYAATLIVRGAMAKGRRVLWLAHTEELVDQAAASLRRLDHRVGVIKAGRPSDPTAPIQVASVQTLVSRPQELPPADILIPDEVHHYVARTYQAIASRYDAAELILGLTATPQRADGKPLGVEHGGILQELVVPTSVAELQRTMRPDGHPILVQCRVIGPASEQRELWKDPLTALRDHARRADGTWRPSILFCASVDEAKALAAEATRAGIRAACVDGDMRPDLRLAAIEAYSSGALDLLTNVMVLTEGFDAVRTEVVGVARGCTAESTWLQMIGRALRASPDTGKRDALLLDFRGFSYRHGLAEDDREYSLDGRGIRRTGEVDPIRQCPSCAAVFRPAEAQRACPRCSMPFTVRRRERARVRASETVEITADRVQVTRARQVSALAGILRQAEAARRAGRPWKDTAIGMRYQGIFGHWPSKAVLDEARAAMREERAA